MSDILTPTEEKVYQYLIEFLAANSYQPSIREIGREFNIKSTKTVSDILGSLARKGYIQRNQARSRGLRILGAQASPTRQVPFYTRLAAVGPALAPEYRADTIIVDRRLCPGENVFFVKVGDDAFAKGGIRRDDTVLVNPDFTPGEGDLVAARVGEEAVVRAFSARDGGAALVGFGSDESAIALPAGDDRVVLGVVAGVFRGTLHADTVTPGAEAAA